MRKTAKTSFFSTLLQWIDHLRPRYCCICQHFVANRAESTVVSDLCISCAAQLTPMYWPRTDAADSGYRLCARCGNDQFVTSGVNCRHCEPSFLPFAQIVAPYRFDYPMQELIHEFKYRKRRYIGRMLGQLLAQAVLESSKTADASESVRCPDVVLPVPMAERQLITRGFSSSALIAASCCNELGLRTEAGWAHRLEDIGKLAGLPRDLRMLKIRGAYRVSDQVKGMHIAIVDDVLTTGATASELARECLDTGALSVSLWVLARTPADYQSRTKLGKTIR